jgi:hypothetical protein
MTDLVNFTFDRQAIEGFEPQGGEELDPGLQRLIRNTEGPAFLSIGASTEAGSGTPQWGVTGLQGQTGQTSLAAWSQTVKTKSISGAPVWRIRPSFCCAARGIQMSLFEKIER